MREAGIGNKDAGIEAMLVAKVEFGGEEFSF
jgi:hypothetical protein